ncbi:MAG: type I-B CRISPR-associated protein Cas7/Csh2 [Candidatus Brocadiaceae bacterium]|nr:type I-B CRISPR-associated protein Cas7/Csh2 [Candidatus Brocadiaceae bacterium]
MIETIKNRSEILFLYDVTDANPNGDPVDENKPRIDEETGRNIVTDVRLKRTIRDYLINFKNKGNEIFVKEIVEEDGKQKTREKRIEEEEIKTLKDSDKLLKYLDIRLFGATIGLKGSKGKKKEEIKDKDEDGKGTSITWTGPVQFKFGRSLHKVNLTFVKGTTVMPSKEGAAQGTFTERYVLPYSLIAFYGIVNENAAKSQKIPLKDADIDLMLEGIWTGTKNLITGSKFGQMPRVLIQVLYKEGQNFHIGELDKHISITSDKNHEAVRDITEVKIDITSLVNALNANKDTIEKIRLMVDGRVQFVKEVHEVKDGKEVINKQDTDIKTALKAALSEPTVEDLVFKVKD